MGKISDEQVQKILCTATCNKLLILTVNDDTAYIIKSSIVEYMMSRGFGTALSNYKQRGWIYFLGGYENIAVMSLSWYKRQAKFDFDGLVYITNKAITDIPHILRQPIPFTELIN